MFMERAASGRERVTERETRVAAREGEVPRSAPLTSGGGFAIVFEAGKRRNLDPCLSASLRQPPGAGRGHGERPHR